MTIDFKDLTAAFFQEAVELLEQAEYLLLHVDIDAPSDEDLNAIFRAAHSIKGGAASFGFGALTETTHLLESLLDRARNRQLQLTERIVNGLLKARDALLDQLRAYEAGGEPDPALVAASCAEIRELDTPEAGASPPAATRPQAYAGATPVHNVLKVVYSQLTGDQPRRLLEELPTLGRVLDAAATDDTLTATLETLSTPDDIVAVACFLLEEDQVHVTTVAAPQAAPAAQAGGAKAGAPAAAKDSSIRVDVEKVDTLVNLVGELVITQSMLASVAAQLDPVGHERLLSGLGQLERNAKDMQESVMRIRMMPVDGVFRRYPRVVRDTSAKLGKQVVLETEGEETELDKSLIERIVDPLTHLVRNSLDHGIETPQERIAAGKNPTGRLLLSAQHMGGFIVIVVADDGAGLNRARILAKARLQGLDVSDDMPDQEVWKLIFAPGFSTAEAVTDISGRGVGMDVVKRNIQEMGGHVEISSVAGRGTTTRIVLPLTLAILNGMSVKVGNETYVLPLNNVLESLQPSAENLHSVKGERHLIRVRGEYLPLIMLHQIFEVPGAKTDPLASILVIVQAGSDRCALMVDELLGQHQVVVKNLETNYRKVPGISAATILGDGSVALIVDVAALAKVQDAYTRGEQLLAHVAARTELVAS
jgi:two-component system, chemotaxis family, sensor kinase CheA